nr:AraC family transcriptional regulator [uncultured Pseudomonas sp.]
MPTGPIQSLPRVITELGGNPQRVFRAAGINLDTFVNDPGQRLGYGETARLLNTAIRHTKCSSLGILVGRCFSLKDLGMIGRLMLAADTVEDALHDLVIHSKLHDRGGAPLLLPLTEQVCLLGYVIHHQDLTDPRSLIDTLIMIGFQTFRELLGPDWTPIRVQLAYHRPSDSATYARAFRCPVQFNASVSGLVVSTTKLDQKLETADPGLHQLLQEAISAATANLRTSELLTYQLPSMLLAGEAKAELVANRMGLHIRTLHRRLNADGTNLQKIVNESRKSLATQMLKNTDLPISVIAQALQYQDPNAFSRAFRAWIGRAPGHWRAHPICEEP